MTSEEQKSIQLLKKPLSLELEEWQTGLNERYQKLRDAVESKIPDAWEPLEFTMAISKILNIKDITLPFAGIILGNPSSSKTVGMELLRILPNTYYSDSFTPKSFVSHNTSVKKSELEKIDLLPRIENKTLLAPELSPMFTKKDDDLVELIGILTRVLDGKGFVSDSGSHGQRGYARDIMFTMVGASVDIPYRVYRLLGSIGPKLYFLRLRKKNKDEEKYLDQLKSRSFSQDLLEIQKLVNDYLGWFDRYPNAEVVEKKNSEPDKPPEYLIKIKWSDKDEQEALRIIVKLGKLLSYLRGVVPTKETFDSQGIDYAYEIATKEEPDRAMLQLYNLARGHALLEGRNYITMADIPLLVRVTLSTASKERVQIFELLMGNEGELSTTDIEEGLNTSANTAKRTMAEFVALGVVTKSKETKHVGNLDVETWHIKLKEELGWCKEKEFTKYLGKPL